MRQLKSPKKITSNRRSLLSNSSRMRETVWLRFSLFDWCGARWQLMNWKGCPKRVISRLIAPLLPIIPQVPAFRKLLPYWLKQLLRRDLTSIALCNPRITEEAARQYQEKTSVSMFSHRSFASQQKVKNSPLSHYWVPMKMISGAEEKEEERESSTRELMGGTEAKRFQVTATIVILSCGQ